MDKRHQICTLAAKFVQEGMASGLTWDETVAALGLAAKALANRAAKEGDGSAEDCHAHAQKRLAEGFAQQIDVSFAAAEYREAFNVTPAEMETVLTNCSTRIFLKH